MAALEIGGTPAGELLEIDFSGTVFRKNRATQTLRSHATDGLYLSGINTTFDNDIEQCRFEKHDASISLVNTGPVVIQGTTFSDSIVDINADANSSYRILP